MQLVSYANKVGDYLECGVLVAKTVKCMKIE